LCAVAMHGESARSTCHPLSGGRLRLCHARSGEQSRQRSALLPPAKLFTYDARFSIQPNPGHHRCRVSCSAHPQIANNHLVSTLRFVHAAREFLPAQEFAPTPIVARPSAPGLFRFMQAGGGFSIEAVGGVTGTSIRQRYDCVSTTPCHVKSESDSATSRRAAAIPVIGTRFQQRDAVGVQHSARANVNPNSTSHQRAVAAPRLLSLAPISKLTKRKTPAQRLHREVEPKSTIQVGSQSRAKRVPRNAQQRDTPDWQKSNRRCAIAAQDVAAKMPFHVSRRLPASACAIHAAMAMTTSVPAGMRNVRRAAGKRQAKHALIKSTSASVPATSMPQAPAIPAARKIRVPGRKAAHA